MIKTERLCLRAPQESDLAALHEVFRDPRAMAYWSHPAHETLERTRKTLGSMIASYNDTGAEYVVEANGKVIGKAGLWRVAEVGYILHPDFWGKGLAFEALSTILPAFFAAHQKVDEITAEIDPRNLASTRLLEKLGFHATHYAKNTLQVAGIWTDSTYFTLKRP